MKIHWKNLKNEADTPFLVLDIIVLILITGNLLWLLLDAILLNTGIGVLIARYHPEVTAHYKVVWHENLLIADSIFTIFLIGELLLRWGIAIYRKTYYRWFFYPFAHWYDVLGCIPLPPFRALRLLRLISITYRLHNLGVIDVSQNRLFIVPYRYYQILLEELSDRIVVNVLEGVQHEIKQGDYVNRQLAHDLLQPHRDRIAPWVASLVADIGQNLKSQHQEKLNRYLTETVRETLHHNPDFQKLRKRLLFVGPAIENELQQIVSSLLVQVTESLLHDLAQPDNAALTEVAGSLLDTLTTPKDDEDNDTLQTILMDALSLLKNRVAVQQWRLEKEGKLRTEQK